MNNKTNVNDEVKEKIDLFISRFSDEVDDFMRNTVEEHIIELSSEYGKEIVENVVSNIPHKNIPFDVEEDLRQWYVSYSGRIESMS